MLKENEEEQPDTTEEEEEDDGEEAAANGEAEEEGDASLEEILTKKGEDGPSGDEDEDSVLSLGREDRIETLSVRVEPKKDTEFVCQNCYLVKPIRSQLADKKRMFCRDCA